MDFSHASFASTRAVVIAAIEAARSAPRLQLVWMMRADEAKKWVKPYGIAIVAAGQLNLAAGAVHHFRDPPRAA